MTLLLLRRMVLPALLLMHTEQLSAQDQSDEEAISELASRWEEAWNKRDAETLGSILAEDVDWVSVQGPDAGGWGSSRGRLGFINAHDQMFTTLFADSHWTNRGMELRFIRPDVAVAYVL